MCACVLIFSPLKKKKNGDPQFSSSSRPMSILVFIYFITLTIQDRISALHASILVIDWALSLGLKKYTTECRLHIKWCLCYIFKLLYCILLYCIILYSILFYSRYSYLDISHLKIINNAHLHISTDILHVILFVLEYTLTNVD